MATEMELLRAGVAALQSGNREGALQALSQVVDLNPYNEQAWFYMAAADHDPFMRKRYLERVLELNPNNPKARDILDKLVAKERAAVPTKTGPLTQTGSLAQTGSLSPPPPSVPSPLSAPSAPSANLSTPPTPLQARLNRTKSAEPPLESAPAASPASPSSPANTANTWGARPGFTSSWDAPAADLNPEEYANDASNVTIARADMLPDPSDFAPLRRNSSARAAQIAQSEGDDELMSRLSATDEVPRAKPSSSKSPTSGTIRALAPDAGTLLGAASGSGGFSLPFDIPGAPARVSLTSFIGGGITLLRGSFRILTRRQDAYANEIEQVTWWRFWLYAIFIAIIQTVLLALTIWIVDARITAELRVTGRVFNFASGLVVLLVGIPFYLLSVTGGSGIGWLVVRQWLKINTSYLKFLYATSVIWLPLSLAATVLAFVFNLLGLLPVAHYSLFALLATTAFAVYAGYNLFDAVRYFEGDIAVDEKELQRRRIAGASTVVGIFVVRLLIGLLFGAITSATVLIFLFT